MTDREDRHTHPQRIANHNHFRLAPRTKRKGRDDEINGAPKKQALSVPPMVVERSGGREPGEGNRPVGGLTTVLSAT